MLVRTCIFRLKLNQYNEVQHIEGFTVTEIDEVKNNKPTSISGEDNSEHDLDHESKELSEYHLWKKRKNPDDEKNLDQAQPDPENTSKGFLEVEQFHDAPRQAKNGGQIPPANSGLLPATNSNNILQHFLIQLKKITQSAGLVLNLVHVTNRFAIES
ncbi:hypothetical protein ACET3Z_013386 [Daucus carota]